MLRNNLVHGLYIRKNISHDKYSRSTEKTKLTPLIDLKTAYGHVNVMERVAASIDSHLVDNFFVIEEYT